MAKETNDQNSNKTGRRNIDVSGGTNSNPALDALDHEIKKGVSKHIAMQKVQDTAKKIKLNR